MFDYEIIDSINATTNDEVMLPIIVLGSKNYTKGFFFSILHHALQRKKINRVILSKWTEDFFYQEDPKAALRKLFSILITAGVGYIRVDIDCPKVSKVYTDMIHDVANEIYRRAVVYIAISIPRTSQPKPQLPRSTSQLFRSSSSLEVSNESSINTTELLDRLPTQTPILSPLASNLTNIPPLSLKSSGPTESSVDLSELPDRLLTASPLPSKLTTTTDSQPPRSVTPCPGEVFSNKNVRKTITINFVSAQSVPPVNRETPNDRTPVATFLSQF